MKVFLKDKDGKRHPVEDLLIAVQSKVLRSCFKYSKFSEVVSLPSIDGAILGKMIDWVNHPQPETLAMDNSEGFFVCDLLVASEFLDMPILSKQIIGWMATQLSSENVLDLWTFSRQFHLDNLQHLCWQFLMRHLNEIKTPQLKALDKEDLLSLLTSDDLRMKEESVWELVEELTGPDDDGTLMMECVRYGLMEESFVTERVLTSSKLQRYFTPKLLFESISGSNPRMPRNLVFTFDLNQLIVMDPSLAGRSVRLPISFPGVYSAEGARCVVDQSTIFIAGGSLPNQLFKLSLDDLRLCPLASKREPWYNDNLVKIGQDLYSVGFGTRIEKYSIATNQWVVCREERVEEREGVEVAVLNGKIYVVGGWNGSKRLRSVEIFDPKSGTWKFGKKMNKGRSSSASAVKDGKLYLTGGWTGGLLGGRRLACGEVFDPQKKSWTALPEMTVPRSQHSMFLADGRLMVAGGYTGSLDSGMTLMDGWNETVEYLDEERGEWNILKNLPHLHPNVGNHEEIKKFVSVPVENLDEKTLEKFRDLLKI